MHTAATYTNMTSLLIHANKVRHPTLPRRPSPSPQYHQGPPPYLPSVALTPTPTRRRLAPSSSPVTACRT
eukprot:6645005-Prymnesium_polylepis.1